MAAGAELTVVLAGRGGTRFRDTVAELERSARDCGAVLETVVVHDSDGARELPRCRPLPLFPLSDAYARSRAVAAASAPLVAFLDAERSIDPGWVRAVLTAFAADPAPAAVAGPVRELPARRRGHAPVDPRAGDDVAHALAARAGGNVAYARAALLEAGAFRVRVGPTATAGAADADAVLRLLARRLSVSWSPDMVVTRAGIPSAPPRRRFVEGRGVGAVARRHRSAALAVAYARARPGRASRTPGAAAGLAGLAAGIAAGAGSRSPTEPLALMPATMRGALEGRRLRPLAASPGAKTHLLYRVGDDRVLHLYVDPSERLRRALAERESIRLRAGVAGIPALHLAAEDVDATWVLEDFVRGTPPRARDPSSWFGRVAEWAVAMAGPPGRPLGETAFWEHHAAEAVRAAPETVREVVGAALPLAGRLPAVHLHGDFQRRNIRLADGRIGLVDWEGAWLEGLPGLDLVFASLLAETDAPDGRVIVELARGSDPPWGRLREPLRRLGVDDDALRPALVTMLAIWALGEARRRERGAAVPHERRFTDLLERCAPLLA